MKQLDKAEEIIIELAYGVKSLKNYHKLIEQAKEYMAERITHDDRKTG